MTRPAVQIFHSGMPGIPQLSATGGAGELAELIHACGVTGFGAVTLDSLTQEDGVATASCSAGLLLADGIEGMDHHIEITGSTNGFNGVYTLSAPPGATACTFPVPAGLPATATGTLILRRAGAGMTRLYSDNYREVYQFADPLVMPGYLLLDDGAAEYATVALAETLADPIDYATATGLCPASPGYLMKTNGGGTSNRSFVLWFWAGGFYLFVAWHATWPTLHDQAYVGACLSRVAADGFPGMVIAGPSVATFVGNLHGFLIKNGGNQSGQFLQRAHTQTGGPVAFTKTGIAFGSILGQGLYPDPNPADNRYDAFGPIVISEGSTNNNTPVRGFMPGLWDPTNGKNLSTLDMLANMPMLPDRKIMLVKCGQVGTGYMVGLDTREPQVWR